MSYIKQLQDYLFENNCTISSITLNNVDSSTTVESVAKEILDFIHAPTVDDPELF